MNDLISGGIDVAKDALDVALAPDAKPCRFKNDRKGIEELLAKLPEPGKCRVTLEGSGGYERRVVAELLDKGHFVARVNPRQIRDFAKALGILAKTDALDAVVLARFGQAANPRCLEATTGQQAELQQLVARRKQLIDLRTAETNRLKQVSSKVAKRSIEAVLKTLEKQIVELETEIVELVEKHDDWKQKADILTSVPGVGEITAYSLLADLPELGQLNREEIAALAGLAPYNHDSGRLKGQRAIAGGRADVRSVLYMAALSATRWNDKIKDFYERLLKAGKPFKKAITACMRKLLAILNAMLKNNSQWNSQNV